MKKHIPNLMTLCNLLSGCTGVVFAMRGNFQAVLVTLMVSEFFDFFDGFAARALHAYSAIGKELDSLADLVSFGLCPAVCLFSWYGIAQPDVPFLRWFPFVLTAASALRLAKFNIDTRQATSFIGLPTPAATLLVCALFMTKTDSRVLWAGLLDSPCFLLICTAVIAWLLVSPIPMFSLKLKSFRIKDNLWIYTFLLISAGLLVWAGIPGFAAVIVLYIALSCLQAVSAR
jgi:CDP-diacylglycerol--serine O-phosphatidyltransferase